MPRPRVYDDLPDNLTFDRASGRYRYANPLTGKRTWFGRDKAEACRRAEIANTVVQTRRDQRAVGLGEPALIRYLVRLYRQTVLPGKPWDPSYRKNVECKLARIERELGDLPVSLVDRVRLGDWLSKNFGSGPGDTYNKWRAALVELWRFAISRKLADFNEAEATLRKSTSLKLVENRRTRRRLTVKAYWAIHAAAPPWLQLAMETSLVTLQAGLEVVNMRMIDFRDDGFLYVIREKTAADTPAAFMKIEVTPQLEELRRRSLQLMAAAGYHSPFLIHRQPRRKRSDQLAGKPHWTYVRREYLTRQFQDARDASGAFNDWPDEERPTFHEIRSLGSRIYRALGFEERYVQALLGHADENTTAIYLSDPGALRPEHFRKARADLNLATLPDL